MSAWLERLITRGGSWIVVVAGLATLVLGVGYLRLDWTDDPEVITLEGSDVLDHYRSYVRRWGSDELIVLAYEVPDAFAPAELERLRELTDALLAVEGVRWVSSLDTAFQLDTGPFGPYLRPLVPDDIEASDDLRRAALESPFVRDTLVSADGRLLLLAVQLEGDELDNADLERRVLGGIDGILAEPRFAGLSPELAGAPVFNRALSELNQRDNALFTPLVLLTLAVALGWMFRSLLATALALCIVLASVVWTLGAMGWLGVPMNITTSLLPPLLMVIAVADSVHVISGYRGRLAADDTRQAALAWTLAEIVPACFWTTATTIVGFASLQLVQIQSVRVFGQFAVLGVGVAFLLSATLLPTLLLRVPLERAAPERPLAVLRACSGLARRAPVALAILLGSLALGGAGLVRVEVATHDGEFFRQDHPINRAYRSLEARLGGVTPFEVELSTPGVAAARSAEGLRAMRALQDRLGALAELNRGTSLADMVAATSPGIDFDDAAAVERSLFLLETLAPGEVRRFVDPASGRARISTRAVAMTSARSEALLREVERLGPMTLPRGWSARATGLVPVFSQMEQYLVEGQLRSYALAFLAIGAIFAARFRSLRVAAIGLAANMVPLALAAAVMGFAGIRLDVATIMVASVALGLIVDDTIHLLSAYRSGRARDLDVERALDEAYRVAGRPIVITSLILMAGFGTLLLSGFQPTAHFGALVCVAVAGALLGDLIVLPAALRALEGAPTPRRRPAEVEGPAA